MPGSVMISEALQREEGCVVGSVHLYAAVHSFSQLLFLASPSSLTAIVSLMSTIHKHVRMYVEHLVEQLKQTEQVMANGWVLDPRLAVNTLCLTFRIVLLALWLTP